MFIKTKKVKNTYYRKSKLGTEHKYTKTQTVGILQCDSCLCTFERTPSLMDKKRFNNDYHHVCSNCEPKRFAQQKGVERRRLWNLPVDSEIDITKI
jgi:hypothetical protein